MPSPSCQHPDGCPKPVHRGDYCSAHAERLRLHGSLGPAEIKQRPDPRKTFERLLAAAAPGFCVLWPHACTPAGYGVMRVNGLLLYTHRVACERFYGPAPAPGLEAAHSCNTPPCMNPHHLRWATSLENTDDIRRAGRLIGYPESMRAQARAMIGEGMSRRAVARALNVDTTTVKRWAG